MSEHADDIERQLVREFSVHGIQIGAMNHKQERREALRRAIIKSGRSRERFHETAMVYSEAFEEVYGERLDRRAVPRDIPDEEGDDEVNE